MSSAPFWAMVAAPFPSTALPLCCKLGKPESVEGAALTAKVTGATARLDRAVTPATPLAAGSRK